jgi:hypothetical protein
MAGPGVNLIGEEEIEAVVEVLRTISCDVRPYFGYDS